ncbi:MAG: hypothetical protein WC942_12210 [Clostridia bacterium]|jgi:hypothetical protein
MYYNLCEYGNSLRKGLSDLLNALIGEYITDETYDAEEEKMNYFWKEIDPKLKFHLGQKVKTSGNVIGRIESIKEWEKGKYAYYWITGDNTWRTDEWLELV